MPQTVYGGCVFQRKQYKKARYRKKEQRQQIKLEKTLDMIFGKKKDGEQE